MEHGFNFFTKDYVINNDGTIFSKKTFKEIKTQDNGTGYKQVTLSRNGLQQRFTVHSLVARTFCPGYKDSLEVNHIDKNKNNNHYTNLERITKGENIIHGLGRRIIVVDKDNNINEYSHIKLAEKETGVFSSNIVRCCQGGAKQSMGYRFFYKGRFDPNNIPEIKKDKTIICIDNKTTYKNAVEAGKELNIDPSSITKVCRGKRKSAGGYKFEYILDNKN